jgi:nucleotidyltransferase-like protein
VYLRRLARVLDAVFDDALIDVYLSGSAAVGAFRAGKSDVDVLVVAERPAPAQLDAVVERCSHARLPVPATKLELVVYEPGALADPGARPRWSLNFDTGPDEHHVGLDPDAEPAHWFVLDLAFARRSAVALTGPPAAELIGDVPDELVGASLRDMVEWYRENEPEHAELADRRARHWATTRRFATKAELMRS